MGDDTLIQLHHVTFGYVPDRSVLSNVSLTLRAGDRVGLTGPNGSGKTTLLRLLVGLHRPQHGRIVMFGRDRCREKDFVEVRARAGLLFQDPEDQLFCPTVAEDVAFGPLNLGMPRDEANRVVHTTLAQLDLLHVADAVTYHLSYGQKKLVALASVLAMKPEVLLLDEPTASLDDEHRERTMQILTRLNLPLITASHDRGFLDRITNRRLRLADAALAEASVGGHGGD